MESIGKRVSFFRNAKRWTQSHLASEISIPQSTLSEIENDLISPKIDILQKIAENLDVLIINFFLPHGKILNNNFRNDNV